MDKWNGFKSEQENIHHVLEGNNTRVEGTTCHTDNLKQYWDDYVRKGNNES